MADNPPTYRGFLTFLGGIVGLAFLVFIATGGQLGGVTKVQSDADLPKVTSPTPPQGADNTGTR